MGLKLNGANAGSVELASPDNVTGGDITLTLPDGVGSAGQVLKNGSTAGTLEFGDFGGPAFRARIDASNRPTFTHNVNTKIPFKFTTFDTDGFFDNTTNYRFQPTTAGYYQVNLSLNLLVPNNKNLYSQLSLQKNGGTYNYFQMNELNVSSTQMHGQIADLVFMNGTTDYIEGFVYYYNYTDGSGTAEAGTATYMSGSFVRAV